MSRKRKRHSAEEVVKKLRDADAMLSAGKDLGAVLQALEVSEATLLNTCVASHRRRSSSVGAVSTTDKNSTGASVPSVAPG